MKKFLKTKKSVIFLLGHWTIGGVERVTVIVANELLRRGWKVGVVAFEIVNPNLLKLLNERVDVSELSFPAYSMRNMRDLRSLMKRRSVSIVVNQWSVPAPITMMLRIAAPHGAKIIAFHHTAPNRNKRVMESRGFKRVLYEVAFKLNLKLVYWLCDAYVVLSESYRRVFKDAAGVRLVTKVCAIPNPVNSCGDESVKKENLILYIGRMDRTEKRVDRVIDVWRRLEPLMRDWRLELLGDGPDRVDLEAYAAGLPRISFRGFCDPSPYLQRAKLLLLTSEFEGFGMVIIEAMSARCVPVVYGSFLSAKDIIRNGNGVIVPMPWNCDEFSRAVLDLSMNEELMKNMAEAGYLSVDRFSPQKIVDQYEALFAKV